MSSLSIPSACSTGTLSLPASSSDGGRETEKAAEVRALGGDCDLVVRRSRLLLLDKSDAARSGLYCRDRFGISARRFGPPQKAARMAQRDDSIRGQILFRVSARRCVEYAAGCAATKNVADPRLSGSHTGCIDRRSLRVFLLSTGESIRT